MAARFSRTQLRVPPGFATILEGLAREVLRDQPEDIPKYAAHYFDALLKQREETGMDPAERAAKLEEKYYNYQAPKATGCSAEKEPAAEIITSKEKSKETGTQNESSLSAEASKVSTTHADAFEEVESTENTQGDEKHEFTEERGISVDKEASEEESINNPLTADLQTGELSGAEEEKDTTIYKLDKVDRETNEKDISSALDHDVPQSASTDLLSYSGVANLDVCAQELGIAEDEVGDKYETAAVDHEIVEGETNTDAEEEGAGVLLHSGLTDVDICATEHKGVERTVENATAEDDTRTTEEESFKPQSDQALTQSSTSRFEMPEGNQQGEDLEEKAMEEEETENKASSVEKHDSLSQVERTSDTDATPKDESLVEISFEDVPEVQQMTEALGKQTELEGSAEVLQTDDPLDQQEESKEVTAETTEQGMFGTQPQDEPETEAGEKEFNSEEEEIESQLEASDIMKEKVTAHSNLNDSYDDEKREVGRNVTPSHHIISEAEDETDHTSKGEEMIREGALSQDEDAEEETKSNASDMKEDEMIDAVEDDKEDKHTGYPEMRDEDVDDSDAVNHPSPVTQTSTTTPVMEGESEAMEARAQHPSEDRRGTPVESEPDNTVEETSEEAEKETEEGDVYSEIREKSDGTCEEESVGHTHVPDEANTDHQEEETPTGSETDTRDPEEEKTTDKQEECSRPQEEEDIMDIPLDDPEANRAAAKIQAGFRGHMTRKKMKPEDKAEAEEVSSTGDVLNGSQGDAATGGSGAVESDATSVPEQ